MSPRCAPPPGEPFAFVSRSRSRSHAPPRDGAPRASTSATDDTFNEIDRTYFHGNFPARAFLGTSKLLRGAHFEVMGIAVKGTATAK